MKNYLYFIILCITSFVYSTELPAHINLSFKTSITVEKILNPNVYATSFIFAMERQMYSTLDGPWDPFGCDTATGCTNCAKVTNLSSFDLTDLIISGPNVNFPSAARISITLGYKESPTDTTKVLLSAINILTSS